MLDDTVSLHSQSTSSTSERRRSPVLVLIWVSVIISHLTLAGLIWFSISNGKESGYQNRAIEDLTTRSSEMRTEMQIWQAYVISLQKKLMENGIQVPEAPLPNANTNQEKEEGE